LKKRDSAAKADMYLALLSMPALQHGSGYQAITCLAAGCRFNDAWESRTAGMLDGVATQFIGREAPIHNKESTGRAKDLGDADELRKRFRME
jgi:hypothetical protein